MRSTANSLAFQRLELHTFTIWGPRSICYWGLSSQKLNSQVKKKKIDRWEDGKYAVCNFGNPIYHSIFCSNNSLKFKKGNQKLNIILHSFFFFFNGTQTLLQEILERPEVWSNLISIVLPFCDLIMRTMRNYRSIFTTLKFTIWKDHQGSWKKNELWWNKSERRWGSIWRSSIKKHSSCDNLMVCTLVICIQMKINEHILNSLFNFTACHFFIL